MQFSFSQKLFGIILLIAIGIIILPFMVLHENITNPTIQKYKTAPPSPSSSQNDHSGVIGFLTRLKTHTQLHKTPSAWMIKSTNVFSEIEANNIVAAMQKQEISAYLEVVNPTTKTVRVKFGPVIKRKEAEAILAKLKVSFPQLKGVIVGYEPMKD